MAKNTLGIDLYRLCGKIETVFNDIYISAHGYVISTDPTDPFLVSFNDSASACNEFFKITGLFKILHIKDIRNFRKFFAPRETKTIGSIDDYYRIVDSKAETDKVIEMLTEKINTTNSITNWNSFIIDSTNDLNIDIAQALFTDYQHINFKPMIKNGEENPIMMLTKSLIPLTTKSNIGSLYYAAKKENKDLYTIVFNIEVEYFRLNMIYHYIPFKN